MLKIFRKDGSLKDMFLIVEKNSDMFDQYITRIRLVTLVYNGISKGSDFMSDSYIKENYKKEDIIYV